MWVAITIRIHDVPRSKLRQFPHRHHLTIPCYVAYPVDKKKEVFGRFSRKPRKAPISFVMSVRVYQCGSQSTDFGEIWYWDFLLKSVDKIQIWLKSDKQYRANYIKKLSNFFRNKKYVVTEMQKWVLFCTVFKLHMSLPITKQYLDHAMCAVVLPDFNKIWIFVHILWSKIFQYQIWSKSIQW